MRGGAWEEETSQKAPGGDASRGMRGRNFSKSPGEWSEAGHETEKCSKRPRVEMRGGAWEEETSQKAPGSGARRGMRGSHGEERKVETCPGRRNGKLLRELTES